MTVMASTVTPFFSCRVCSRHQHELNLEKAQVLQGSINTSVLSRTKGQRRPQLFCAWAENGACQKMHNDSRGNAFHMFTIRHTIWSLICTPNMVWIATTIYWSLLCHIPWLISYCFTHTMTEMSWALLLHGGGVTLSYGNDHFFEPQWQIPVHNRSQTCPHLT